tara:strand:- start:433 stop:978 length:546 start_codon:yes stop_codon:yes gene_type:complete
MLTITKEAEKAIDNCLAHFLTDESFYRVNDNGQIVAVPCTMEDPSVPSSDVSEQDLLFTIVHDRPSVHLVARDDSALLDFCKSYHIEHDWELNVERARQEILKILSCVRWFGCCCEGDDAARLTAEIRRSEDKSRWIEKLERRAHRAELRVKDLEAKLSTERTERWAAQRTIARLGGGEDV